MPTYEYESSEPRLRVICMRPVEDRDKPILLTRVQVPTGISLANTDTGRSKAPSLEKDIRAGYAKLEDKEGSRYRDSGDLFSKDEVRKAWEAEG
jgi:hypothetical protein